MRFFSEKNEAQHSHYASSFLFSHQAAGHSQARQNRADDSRQGLQDEFPSFFLFHGLPPF